MQDDKSEAIETETPTTMQPWRRAFMWVVSRDHKPGTLIVREELFAAMGIEMPGDTTSHGRAKKLEMKFLQQFTRLRVELLEQRRIDLAARPGIGYEVIDPREQAPLAVKDTMRDVRKAIEDGTRRVEFVDTSALNDAERAQRADAQAKLAHLDGLVKMSARRKKR